ncbi:tetratricopeptide repeat protein [Hymenobacter edaphi]|uniref:Uncharacterized protein n=1 Tax=Hymenobacter edaphi TaxID=2211146 RepID=A0A328BIG6_9BACT|nr:tetratricopeptide repeat protein [Hymenobacter edaphi]RAK66933.1 hypothetical protein DLM85_12060 [Hymenobacter edaphi]
MTTGVPMVKPVAWVALLPALAVMALAIWFWQAVGVVGANAWALGAATHLLLAWVLRGSLGRYHQQGIRLVKQEKFAEAIPCFEQSYHFFQRHTWIDRWRYLTMLSAGKMSYREMALNNIAFCYGQVGNGQQAKAYYEQALREFPGSGLAKAGLRMLESVHS